VSADGLVTSATIGVQRMAALRGLELAPRIPRGSSSWERLVIFIGGIAILALVCFFTYARVPHRRRRPTATRA
jgi:hypothetical protein